MTNTPRLSWWNALALVLDQRTGWKTKVVAALAFLYIVLPLDLIPDVIPLLGWVDDALVAIGSILTLVRMVRTLLEHKS